MSQAFALTYGSFGDLIETARLAVKVVRILRDGGKMSQERLALTAELQALNSDLISLDCVVSGVALDPSCTRSLPLLLRIRSEVDVCHTVLLQFLENLSVPRGILGNILLAIVEDSDLARFRVRISGPLNTIHTLISTLNLITSHGAGVQLKDIASRIEHMGDQFNQFLISYQEMVLELPISRGVADDIFCVIDPVGGNIPVSLRYCRVYTDLDRIIKAHLPIHLSEAGSRYVHRGDYSIVSTEGSVIPPAQFTRTIRAGMQVEMSILKRRLQSRRDVIQNTQCPYCCHENASDAGNEWFKCSSPMCGRKYRHQVDDGGIEEIVSPQIMEIQSQGEPELFRLVHILMVYADDPMPSHHPSSTSSLGTAEASASPSTSSNNRFQCNVCAANFSREEDRYIQDSLNCSPISYFHAKKTAS